MWCTRRKIHHSIRDVKRACRTRARVKDLDQIHDDLKTPHKLLEQESNADLPGLGQHYCIHCARHFVSKEVLDVHCKSKLHKKRVKQLEDEPYTQKHAEEAAGLKTDNGTRSNVSMVDI
ncbi:hypothetical protein SeMB42_g03851 [Synchytrium endobioticum]|uniref:C2H2-type domain-containing protein n=1 Tax=Synchytrium endobioticum TaxID=286115 RepID=A0A507D397_9FUNG|nr:hypothetical protein SeMB42_g03851 [Synchytrium endobioticum]